MYFLDHYRTRISQVIGLLFLLLFVFSQKELDVTAPYISGILFLVGCLCVGAAMAGRIWCAQYIAGYKNDVLVREGPYSVCRNPLYFFSFLGCTASLGNRTALTSGKCPAFSRNGHSTMNRRNIRSSRKSSAMPPATSSGSSWPSASWNVSKPCRNRAFCRSSSRFIKLNN